LVEYEGNETNNNKYNLLIGWSRYELCSLDHRINVRRQYQMPVLRIPTPLRSYTNGQSEVDVNGSTVSEALADLTNQFPTIEPHIFHEDGKLRPFVNLFVGEDNIKDLEGVATKINDGEKIMLIPSIAGGCHCEEERSDNQAIFLYDEIAWLSQETRALLAMTLFRGG
ncbi:MAG TPA: MoaD/ThiS family protein, partial [Anaerolineales bacterium]|nr:MoaD/ThiS family protein [Anaerolineales bacterium]